MKLPISCSRATFTTPEGSAVLVVEDAHKEQITVTRTRSVPWRLGSKERPGDAVVLLEGRSGGFLLERCYVVPAELELALRPPKDLDPAGETECG